MNSINKLKQYSLIVYLVTIGAVLFVVRKISFILYVMKIRFLNAIEPELIPGEAVATKEGFSFNPLLKYPRNESCYCHSGKKYKQCCLKTELPTIPKEGATQAAKLVKFIRENRNK